MSTAVRSWSDRAFPGWRCFRRMAAATFVIFWLLRPVPFFGQSAAGENQKKAHQILEAAIQALGGSAWLNLRTTRVKGQIADFYQGLPTGTISDVDISTELPNKQRIDFGKGKDVQIFVGSHAWEITYQGKKPLPENALQDVLRRQAHSIDTVLRNWYCDPATVLIDEGQTLVERRLADKVMLLRPANDAVTLEIDAERHLPLRLSYEWRDPRFHDKNTDVVEYDNYQKIGGIATPFTVTSKRNGETIRQQFIEKIAFNLPFSKDLFDPDVAAAHLK